MPEKMKEGMENEVVQHDLKEISQGLSDISHKFEGKTVLIAGGAGFLGKYLVLTLDYLNKNVLKTPCEVIVLDNYITGIENAFRGKEHITVIKQDISKPFHTEKNVDYIIHAASLASPVFYNNFRLETIDVGFLGTKNLLELAKEKNSKSFLFFSSSEIYGNPDPKFIPTPETYLGNVSCIGPRSPYDEPKRIGETLTMTYGRVYNLPVKIVRPFNIFGPGMRLDDGRVVPNFVTAALKGEKIPVYGDGRRTRTFCYISDAIVGFYKILLSDQNQEVFNIGTDDHETSMKLLADLIHGLVENHDSEINIMDNPMDIYGKNTDPDRRFPDLSKIRTTLGYKPKVNLITGLKRFISWARSEMDTEIDKKYSDKLKCDICGENELTIVLDLGDQPLANKYPKIEDIQDEKKYPLQVCFCNNCKNVQLSQKVSRSTMFEDYYYLSSVNLGLVKYFENLAQQIKNSDFVVDVGSNDGILLEPLKKLNVKCLGVDPSVNVGKMANDKGLTTIVSFFNDKCVDKIISDYGKPDTVVCSSTFTHLEDPHNFIRDLKKLMREDGKFIVEVEYIGNFIKNVQFERFYLDRIFYYSLTSLKKLFKQHGMDVIDVEEIEPHGGSLKVTVYNESQNKLPTIRVLERLKKEQEELTLQNLLEFKDIVNKNIKDFKETLVRYKERGIKVCGYGSPARVSTICNYGQIGKDLIPFTVDDSPLKQGKFTPGTHIPIASREQLEAYRPEVIVMFAYEYFNDIKNKLSGNYRYLLPIPPKEIV